MLPALLRHRLTAALKGAACVRLPLGSASRETLEAATREALQSIRDRVSLSGLPAERALHQEFRDRLLGQLTLVSVMVAAVGAAVLMAAEGAPNELTVVVAVVPSMLWMGVQLAGERLRQP